MSADHRQVPKRRELTEAQRQRILQTYGGCRNIQSTVKTTGFTDQTVFRVLYENGYSEADLGRHITARTIDLILEHHRRGKSVRTLAGRYRVREETVKEILANEDI
ncbi:hypothetical protein M3B43_09765 [Nesterenkonia massiliensis]|uniref:Helix-turn-helix domain containing protein n=1 Tax=Nesterenkonia massiliensis TaxID=1232429 RepID=A0ABT2HSH4_9MICC|nr:hypothetical protein [Nesterenkonia massiliensis]MCT1607601.1 hypothetical protein [Nesterenkonia massiliensis]